jgi:hypothetical protein
VPAAVASAALCFVELPAQHYTLQVIHATGKPRHQSIGHRAWQLTPLTQCVLRANQQRVQTEHQESWWASCFQLPSASAVLPYVFNCREGKHACRSCTPEAHSSRLVVANHRLLQTDDVHLISKHMFVASRCAGYGWHADISVAAATVCKGSLQAADCA